MAWRRDRDPFQLKLRSEAARESRQKWHDFSKDMYAIAMAYLEEHLERVQTEGMGDCWLLSPASRGGLTGVEYG